MLFTTSERKKREKLRLNLNRIRFVHTFTVRLARALNDRHTQERPNFHSYMATKYITWIWTRNLCRSLTKISTVNRNECTKDRENTTHNARNVCTTLDINEKRQRVRSTHIDNQIERERIRTKPNENERERENERQRRESNFSVACTHSPNWFT